MDDWERFFISNHAKIVPDGKEYCVNVFDKKTKQSISCRGFIEPHKLQYLAVEILKGREESLKEEEFRNS